MNSRFKGKKALVVDDIPVNVKIMTILLNGLGIDEVVHAYDAKEALEKCPDGGFALALLDIHLGGNMDGYQLAGKLKANHPETFILGVTGNRVTYEFLASASERGMDHVLEKPVTKDALRGVLEKGIAD